MCRRHVHSFFYLSSLCSYDIYNQLILDRSVNTMAKEQHYMGKIKVFYSLNDNEQCKVFKIKKGHEYYMTQYITGFAQRWIDKGYEVVID